MTGPAQASRPVFQERWEVVQEEIRRRILNGEMPPGSLIPETELADSMGVSRGPVREALRALEVKGLVSRRPRRTSIVTPVTKRDVDELFGLRAEVECLAIRTAMARNPQKLAADLQTALNALEAAFLAGDVAAANLADLDLHGAFYRWSDHARVQAVWDTIRDPLEIMMRITNRSQEPGWRETLGGHRPIVDAAAAGDVAAVERLTREHFEDARRVLQPFVD